MKVTIIVVIYKQKIEECKTFQTLKKTLFLSNRNSENVNIIIYDNSPEKQEFSPDHYKGIRLSYFHDSRNKGVTTAYNYAYSLAVENESEWLLLLDHDTELTSEYVEQIMSIELKDLNIAAVVPKINSANQMISPVYSNSLRPLQGKKPNVGIQKDPVMAINSGSLVRVLFLNEIRGFNEEFPLDYLDHWLFHEIYMRGYQVWLLNVSLEHELSVMDYSRVSLKRYQSILESENKYYRYYQPDLYQHYRAQLAKRFIKQLLIVKNKKIALYTLFRLFSK